MILFRNLDCVYSFQFNPKKERKKKRKKKELICWHFEPSQPQRITSGLKSTSTSLLFTPHTSSNHKFHENHQTSPDTNLHKTKHTQHFRRISPFGVLPLLKKHIRPGHAGIVDHSVDLLIPDFEKVYEKRMFKSNNNNNKKECKCITANTSAIWQNAAHSTDQLTSPSCSPRSHTKKPIS